jgi:uncharacterized repeat protein (TIGR01451 family)
LSLAEEIHPQRPRCFITMFARKGLGLFVMLLLLLATAMTAMAQVDNRVPFKHRVGNPAPGGNIFRIQGDFAIIGNTNITLTYYNDSFPNSGNLMSLIDVDDDPSTLNSSSATLVFSQENEADASCSEILYAGLYWSGRAQPGRGFTFDVEKGDLPGLPQEVNEVQLVKNEIAYTDYFLQSFLYYDNQELAFPEFMLLNSRGLPAVSFQFNNGPNNRVQYKIGDGEWTNVNNLQISSIGNVSTAKFDPVVFIDQGISISVTSLFRASTTDFQSYNTEFNGLEVKTTGVYIPLMTKTYSFDKRKVKLKGPNATAYTEVSAVGNNILFPIADLGEMYVGYADVTEYVKSQGMGNYTVADLALDDGFGDAIGLYGHWGLVVIYQNSKMNWRDVTLFDGYSFVRSLDQAEHSGEIEISGFGAVQQGPVDMKLGIMAGEGDLPIEGDFFEIQNQNKEWVRLNHPKNTPNNFFNSSIYTPVSNALGVLMETPRMPNLLNNTGIDIVVWDISNPDNSIIANEQTSIKFRFGSKQDLYNIYAMAFSVRSYLPVIEAMNQLVSINGVNAGENPTAKPGEEIAFQLQVRNRGEEGTTQTKIVIPLPHTTTFVSAAPIPEGYGTVSFDPSLGIAGSIIWDLGNVPLLSDPNEVIASLSYTLKVTEDCFVLANNSCEAVVSVTGTVVGVGSNSGIGFSGTSFIRGMVAGICSDETLKGPLEIPIVGKAEFAATKCQGYSAFTGLKDINLPVFCQGDSPIDLKTLILPSQSGYNVYFFQEEEGGTAIFDYQVNTSIAGSEKIWVSEGPQGSCTGFRIPVTLTVIPRALVPVTTNIERCIEPGTVGFAVDALPDHVLVYFPDNNPLSLPLATIPILDSNIPGRFTVWVSQLREGFCESSRREVVINLEDCSLRPNIDVSIAADVANFTFVGQVITFTIIVTNNSKSQLFEVVLNEQRTQSDFKIPLLEGNESKSFTVSYTVTAQDLSNRSIYNSVFAFGTDAKGTIVQDTDEVAVFSFPPGFIEAEVKVTPELCNGSMGSLEINFKQIAQNGSYNIVNKANGTSFSDNFINRSVIAVPVPPGDYEVSILDDRGSPFTLAGTFTVDGKESVDFTVIQAISACVAYALTPSSPNQVVYELIGPNGNPIPIQNGTFQINQTGTYILRGRDPQGILCPLEKAVEAIITQPTSVALVVLPFCKGDIFTTVQMMQDPGLAKIRWYKLEGQLSTPLPEYDNSKTLTVQDNGRYEVNLIDDQGCIAVKGIAEVQRSLIEVPLFSPLYTICPKENEWVTLSAGKEIVESKWYLNGAPVSNAPEFRPELAGNYSLVATDLLGCDHVIAFDVETQCEALIRIPNAVRPGVAESAFVVFPDKLAEELEIFIQNRWGELIYYCKDSNVVPGKPSSCIWDGTINNRPVINGSYVFTVSYKVKGQQRVVTEQGTILVVD